MNTSLYKQLNNSTYSNITLREYHATTANDRAAVIALSLGAIAATAKAGQYAVQGYNEYRASVAEEEKRNEELRAANKAAGIEDEETTAKAQGEDAAGDDSADEKASTSDSNAGARGKAKDAPRENFFAKFFNLSVGSKYYEGGFEEQMTRKEAALILGVRESSTPKRIKEAHRKLLILNHPDTGGSTYIAGKINEAKELLLKGKRGM
eukprot:g14479.t1 g14479   contig9:1922505-1923243(-)